MILVNVRITDIHGALARSIRFDQTTAVLEKQLRRMLIEKSLFTFQRPILAKL